MRIYIAATFLLLLSRAFSQPTWDAARKEKIDQAVQNPFTKALIVYQDGDLVYQYGNPHQTYRLFSVRKSLLSLLYGMYAQDGKINLNATLQELDIDDKDHLTTEEKQAKVMDLLKARSGVYHVAAFETPGMVKNRPQRGEYKPGEHWFYNNWDFNALTTIFEKRTGLSVFKAFDQRIAKPIGMEDFDLQKQGYYSDTFSIHTAPQWMMSASDLSKLGLLLLNNGEWKKQQIVPSAWIKESTTPYSDLGILGGYGYCWWAALNGEHFPFVKLPAGTFSARGTGEQVLLVIPEKKIVLVHMTEVNSPTDPMMKVTAFGRLLKVVFE